MIKSFLIYVSLFSMLEVKCYGFKDKAFTNVATENSILEINVDGTTGYLRGKQLTTIGSNKKNFFTFRNIPFAKEPERFMVQFAIEFLIIIMFRIVFEHVLFISSSNLRHPVLCLSHLK